MAYGYWSWWIYVPFEGWHSSSTVREIWSIWRGKFACTKYGIWTLQLWVRCSKAWTNNNQPFQIQKTHSWSATHKDKVYISVKMYLYQVHLLLTKYDVNSLTVHMMYEGTREIVMDPDTVSVLSTATSNTIPRSCVSTITCVLFGIGTWETLTPKTPLWSICTYTNWRLE
jgi:hypothetical protein